MQIRHDGQPVAILRSTNGIQIVYHRAVSRCQTYGCAVSRCSIFSGWQISPGIWVTYSIISQTSPSCFTPPYRGRAVAGLHAKAIGIRSSQGARWIDTEKDGTEGGAQMGLGAVWNRVAASRCQTWFFVFARVVPREPGVRTTSEASVPTSGALARRKVSARSSDSSGVALSRPWSRRVRSGTPSAREWLSQPACRKLMPVCGGRARPGPAGRRGNHHDGLATNTPAHRR